MLFRSCNIDFYEYDSNGFLCKEWNGADLNGSGNPIGYPQKRYLFNNMGLLELGADYLGKVTMQVYSDCLRIIQTRIYADVTAMARSVFLPSEYDANIGDDSQTDDWSTRTLYENYGYYGKPLRVYLPTGGKIHQYYDRDTLFHLGYSDNINDSGDQEIHFGVDGRPILEIRTISHPIEDQSTLHSLFVYDSMNRPVHEYVFEYDIDPYSYGYDISNYAEWPDSFIRHKEYGYNAAGQKLFEKNYKVKRIVGYPQTGGTTFEPTTEKYIRYEYDILDRLIWQETAVASGEPNAIVQCGYDAVGNQIYVIDPRGNVLFTDYDNANRKTKEYFATSAVWLDDIVNGVLNVESTKLNAKCRTHTQYWLDDKVKAMTQYDNDGVTVLAVSEFIYDSRGRVETVRQLIKDNDVDGQISSGDDVANTN